LSSRISLKTKKMITKKILNGRLTLALFQLM
jgi:hypothetical protein